ncbi:thioesterase family protein [Jackrogersella minutella]|nr:thioesterase family protein [Jackrogersella minutella]
MADTLKKQIALQQIAPSSYTADWHADWTLGSTLFGGSIAAIIHHAAATHAATEPALAARDQPDILSMHVEFLRPCERCQSTVVVNTLKIGAKTSTIQLQLSQNGKLKVIALATTTNFDKPIGPTVSTTWALLPPVPPVPDFDRILAQQPDSHWLPACLSGEIIPVTSQLLILNPRRGFPVDGICDGWYGCKGDERMDATYLAMMTDVIPSMSDTLLRNGGLYDAHAFFRKMEKGAEEHPGVPAEITNSVDEAMRATLYNNTVTLDLEFKRRVPEGLRWIQTRVSTKMLHEGRMDIDITMCNSEIELICTAHQLILVLEAERKFRSSKPGPVL